MLTQYISTQLCIYARVAFVALGGVGSLVHVQYNGHIYVQSKSAEREGGFASFESKAGCVAGRCWVTQPFAVAQWGDLWCEQQ